MTILADELCDKLCIAAQTKSHVLGSKISFAICDQNGLSKLYRRFGDILVLSTILVPAKLYTAAITQSTTSSIKKLSVERGSLKSFQANDPKLTLVAGGYPFVGGNTEAQDIEFVEHVLRVFKEIIA